MPAAAPYENGVENPNRGTTDTETNRKEPRRILEDLCECFDDNPLPLLVNEIDARKNRGHTNANATTPQPLTEAQLFKIVF